MVPAWEVWNEQNTTWKPAPNVNAYAAVLATAYNAIKSVNSNLFVLAGGLAAADNIGTDIAPITFMNGLYAAGANKYFDALAMHPYAYPGLPAWQPGSIWQQMSDMHDAMVTHGDSSKQIWITEFGAPTGTAAQAVSESVQAQSISIALQYAQSTPWIGPIFIYQLRDAGTQSGPEQNFGLLRYDYTAKPAYSVVKQFMTGTT